MRMILKVEAGSSRVYRGRCRKWRNILDYTELRMRANWPNCMVFIERAINLLRDFNTNTLYDMQIFTLLVGAASSFIVLDRKHALRLDLG